MTVNWIANKWMDIWSQITVSAKLMCLVGVLLGNVLKTAGTLWKQVIVKLLRLLCSNVSDKFTFKLWRARPSVLLHSVSFKASSVRHGPQQPSGPEPRSLSSRLQQFWRSDSPGASSDSFVSPTTLFIQLCWRLWPSALSRGAAENPAA